MKVLQINSVCGYGSTGRIVTDIYGVLKAKEHDCLIAYGRHNAPIGINSYRIGSDLDVYLHVLGTRIFDRNGFYSKNATSSFICRIEQYSPDIIHLHNLHGYYINIELLFDFLRVYNKPIVWTFHDCWAFTGHCTHFDYVCCEKWKSGCYGCQLKTEYPSSRCLDNSKWNYEMKRKLFTSISNMTIVTPSKWLSGLVSQSFLGKGRNVVINNGVDLEKFKPSNSDFRKKHSLEDRFIVLGVASVWTESKGLADFILLSKMLNDKYRIVLVGIGPKESKLLPRNILYISRTNSAEELAGIYSAADVFVNPSKQESFGNVTIEALACGTPAIVYGVTGCAESVNEKSGIVVDIRVGVDGILKAIQEIKKNPFKKEGVVMRGRKYGKEDRFNEYLKIYSENA